jgi:DNA-binding NarL/FixJ family response regulator
MNMDTYRIVLADDHLLFRQGIRKVIEEKKGLKIVGEVSNGLELLKFLKKKSADMVVLDIAMPDLRGIEATREAKMISPDVKILILTMYNTPEYLHHSLSAGADGYLLKENSDKELFSAIQKIRKGEIYVSESLAGEMPKKTGKRWTGDVVPLRDRLTRREKEVLKLVSEGKSSKEIAKLLAISVRTAEHHRANLKKRLGIHRTAALTKYAIQKGYTLVDA